MATEKADGEELFRKALGKGPDGPPPEGYPIEEHVMEEPEFGPDDLMELLNISIEQGLMAAEAAETLPRRRLVARSFEAVAVEDDLAPHGHHYFQIIFQDGTHADVSVHIKIEPHGRRHDHD